MITTILILIALFSLSIVMVYIAKAFDYLSANWSSPTNVDYASNYNNYDYKVPRDSAGKRISALFTYTPPIPKPPKATFFGKLDGKEFSIETPEEEKYLDTTGIHL